MHGLWHAPLPIIPSEKRKEGNLPKSFTTRSLDSARDEENARFALIVQRLPINLPPWLLNDPDAGPGERFFSPSGGNAAGPISYFWFGRPFTCPALGRSKFVGKKAGEFCPLLPCCKPAITLCRVLEASPTVANLR